jgi:hypothetical protein
MEMQAVYFVENVRWTHQGRPASARQFTQHDLPDPIAERALRTGVAVPADSTLATTFRFTRGNGFGLAAPDLARAIDLDALRQGHLLHSG